MHATHTPTPATAIWLAVLATHTGCGGTDVDHYLICDRPWTRRELVELAEHVNEHERTIRTPAATTTPNPDTWTGTVGSFLAEMRVAQQQIDTANEQRRATNKAAIANLWATSGIQPVTFAAGTAPRWDGHAIDTGNSGLRALLVVNNEGCRCGHGGANYHPDATDDDITPPAWLVTTRHGGIVASDPASIDGLDTELADTTRSINNTHTATVAELTSYANLDQAAIETMDIPTYVNYTKRFGIHHPFNHPHTRNGILVVDNELLDEHIRRLERQRQTATRRAIAAIHQTRHLAPINSDDDDAVDGTATRTRPATRVT